MSLCGEKKGIKRARERKLKTPLHFSAPHTWTITAWPIQQVLLLEYTTASKPFENSRWLFSPNGASFPETAKMTLAIRLFLHRWSKWRASVRLRIQPKMMKECAGVMQTLYYVTSSLTANVFDRQGGELSCSSKQKPRDCQNECSASSGVHRGSSPCFSAILGAWQKHLPAGLRKYPFLNVIFRWSSWALPVLHWFEKQDIPWCHF